MGEIDCILDIAGENIDTDDKRSDDSNACVLPFLKPYVLDVISAE